MDVKRPRTEWIPQSGRHAAICNAVEFQFRLTRDHGIGRRPARPFPPVGPDSLSRPGTPFTSDPDPVAHGTALGLDVAEILARRNDYEGSRYPALWITHPPPPKYRVELGD